MRAKEEARSAVRRELEAISRYAQFRLRGVSYEIKMVEDRDALHLIISVPVNLPEERE